MPSSPKPRGRQATRRKSPIILVLLLVLFSVLMGSVLAQSISAASSPPNLMAQAPAQSAPSPIGAVDIVTPPYELGQKLYLETCTTCHIAVPPAVLPSETWRRLLSDTQHYGQQIQLPLGPSRQLIWRYLRDYSRPHNEDEELPYRLWESRFFKVLHPRVKIPRPLTLSSCASCHPGASQYDFYRLSPEWENAP